MSPTMRPCPTCFGTGKQIRMQPLRLYRPIELAPSCPDAVVPAAMQMGKLVRRLRDKLKLPETFTLDACRHGGMTELEEVELTDGQGRALSGHRNPTGL
jgi:hypothetical protein